MDDDGWLNKNNGKRWQGTAKNTTGANKAEANNISKFLSIKISYIICFSTSYSKCSYAQNIDPVVLSWMTIFATCLRSHLRLVQLGWVVDPIGIFVNPKQKAGSDSEPENRELSGGNSNIFGMFTPKIGEMIQFDGRIFFQMGWFNHQLESF